MYNKRKLGQNIKNYRILKGITQTQLAEKIGCSQGAIGMYETGKREPNMDTIEAIANALSISALDLIPLNQDIDAKVHEMDKQRGEIKKGITELRMGYEEFDRNMKALKDYIDCLKWAFDELDRLRGEAG